MWFEMALDVCVGGGGWRRRDSARSDPLPARMEAKPGRFVFDGATAIVFDAGAGVFLVRAYGLPAAGDAGAVTGAGGDARGANTIFFGNGEGLEPAGEKAHFTVTPDGVESAGAQRTVLWRANLAAVAAVIRIRGRLGGRRLVCAVEIVDWPRFAWRGCS